MAHLGHEVVGVDVNEEVVRKLNDAEAPFFEPGLPELLAAGRASKALRFVSDITEVRHATVHFICVGTPQKLGEFAADLRFVDAAFEALLPHLKPGDVVVGKSTVPVGTAERLAANLHEVQPEADLIWNPEFLREGKAVSDTIAPDRFVYGVQDGEAGRERPPP